VELPPFIKQLNDWLAGEPDNVLTIILLALAAFAVGVALFGKPAFKAVLAAWFIAP
jgi:hypothetical protein